jgi:hypothetical protein
VASCCEYGDESSGSGTTESELVGWLVGWSVGRSVGGWVGCTSINNMKLLVDYPDKNFIKAVATQESIRTCNYCYNMLNAYSLNANLGSFILTL